MDANKDDIKDQLDNLIGEYKKNLEDNLQDNNNKLNLNDGNGGYILLQDANGADLTLTAGNNNFNGSIIINSTTYTNIGVVTDGNIDVLIKNYNKMYLEQI